MKQNYSYYSTSRKLMVYTFAIGVFLTGCSSGDELPNGYYDYSGVNNWQLQKKDGGERKEDAQGMHGRKKKRLTRKRKRIKNQENRKENLNNFKHRRLGGSGEISKEVKNKKKGKKTEFNGKQREGRNGIQKKKRQRLIMANQQVNGRRVKKRKRPSFEPKGLAVVGKTNGEMKKKRRDSNNRKTKEKQLKLVDLPEGIIQDIISYLPFSERMLVRGLNHFFYTISTGYTQVGMIGVANKPDYKPAYDPELPPKNLTWSIDKTCGITKFMNFGILASRYGLGWTSETIPSFAFYVLMRRVDNLPRAYWPYLRDSQIHELNLGWNKLRSAEMVELGTNLQGKVHRVCLMFNNLGPDGAEQFATSLPEDTSVREINLSNSKLKAAGATRFTERLTGTVYKIDLSSNKIKNEGAIAVAKNLQDKGVEEIDLGENEIENEGVIGVIRYLQGTSVKKLCLRCNQIADAGVMEATKYILGTKLEELYLGCNKITDQGAVELVKGCRGGKMKRLGLNFNRGITDEGVLQIAKNIEGTVVEEIDLRQYKVINKKTQQKVRKKCPHIKWIFENEDI